MALSNLGIFHTVVGIVAIVAALIAFVKYGKIDLGKLTGKIYFHCTLVTSLTALGVSKHGGFNPGHAFSILIILLIFGAYILSWRNKVNIRARYFEIFCLSFSFFLSLVPTVNETFTRVPVGHPLAKDIKDPIIANTLLTLLVLFIAGTVYQILQQRKINRSDALQK